MKTETLPIDTLSPDPANVRTHSERNIDALVASLRAYGQQKPIVIDGNNVVIAGNGTLEAAKKLGWTEIGVVRSDLTGSKAVAFAIADNRTAELATWSNDDLARVLQSLSDEIPVEDVGFTADEIARLVPDWDSDTSLNDADEYDPSKHEAYTIKVAGVRHDDRDDVLAAVNEALKNYGGDYTAEAV